MTCLTSPDLCADDVRHSSNATAANALISTLRQGERQNIVTATATTVWREPLRWRQMAGERSATDPGRGATTRRAGGGDTRSRVGRPRGSRRTTGERDDPPRGQRASGTRRRASVSLTGRCDPVDTGRPRARVRGETAGKRQTAAAAAAATVVPYVTNTWPGARRRSSGRHDDYRVVYDDNNDVRGAALSALAMVPARRVGGCPSVGGGRGAVLDGKYAP